MEFDVIVVGAGPAGLGAGCRLMQLAAESERELTVAIVEKGSEIGAHILSGAVFEPKPLTELFPDWAERGAPVTVPVTGDVFHWMTSDKGAVKVPNLLVPKPMHNDGNYIVSLGRLCQWLGEQAEGLGCDIFPGFAATEVLYNEAGAVCGVATGDMGVGVDGEHKGGYQEGYELRAKYVIFSEGCRGSLGKELINKFSLAADSDPQHYGIGLKEIWTVEPEKHKLGTVVHTLGWPLDGSTDGGGFLYHADDNQVYLGVVISLSYSNPHLSPFDEFQRWKQHPRIRAVLEGGKRVSYGARALNKGGLHSLPKLSFPGGLLAGCEAGFLNAAKIKGSHTAMKTGMLAAESIFAALAGGDEGGSELADFASRVEASWVHEELYAARNFSAGLKKFGVTLGGSLAFIEHNLLGGKAPWSLHNKTPDHATLKRADEAKPIDYPKPDGVISFDRLSSVFLSSTNHEEDQPCHLRLADADLPVRENLPRFDEPAQRYCPAGVYEVLDSDEGPRFQINAQNCVHCKTCDIKDPAQNITWVPPEGGGGPNYPGM
jgi:electron-transferring-flavoprotein dehydrogenase